MSNSNIPEEGYVIGFEEGENIGSWQYFMQEIHKELDITITIQHPIDEDRLVRIRVYPDRIDFAKITNRPVVSLLEDEATALMNETVSRALNPITEQVLILHGRVRRRSGKTSQIVLVRGLDRDWCTYAIVQPQSNRAKLIHSN